MIRDSLKWMLLTLLLAGIFIAAGLLFVLPAIAPAVSPAPVQPTDEILPIATPQPTETQPPATDTPAPEDTPQPTEEPSLSDRLDAYIAGMSTEEKLGQLVMFGFSGTSSVSSEFAGIMDDYHIGNVILYGYNIVSEDGDGGFSRCARLTQSVIQANTTGIPLLISTDVEGGTVVRFRWSPWPSSARTLGKKNDTDKAYSQFVTIGSALHDVGINMDLAPVLDVAESPESSFLGTRIISARSEVAARIGAAIIEGLGDGGVLSTAKHFPGHGAAAADSHNTTPVINRTLSQLWNYDLIPFAAAVEADVDAVLVGHLLFPDIDDDIASMSSVFINDLLRGEMGFDGLVISDDFRMAGLTKRYSVEDAAVQFLLAGGDIILCGPQHDRQRTIMDALQAAAADGTLSQARMDQSVRRVLLAKMKVTDFEP